MFSSNNEISIIEKEVKKYKRGNSFNYRINLAKSDGLTGNVFILNPKEYEKIMKQIETLNKNNSEIKKQLQDQEIKYSKKLSEKDTRIKQLETEIKKLKENNKSIEEIEKIHQENIKELNSTNNENINQLNESYVKKYENLTALNTVLISGLENLQTLGFIDRVTNKNKQIATKLIKDNVKQIPKYELDLKKEKD